MKKALLWGAAAVVFVVSAEIAPAQEAGGVKIGGNVTMKTKVDNAVNAAVGNDTLAKQQVGGIQGNVDIKGNVTQETEAKNVVNAAIGNKSRACQNIGGISSNADCQ